MDEKEEDAAAPAVASADREGSFAFLPVYPFWATLIIAVDVLAIWSLSAPGRVLAGA